MFQILSWRWMLANLVAVVRYVTTFSHNIMVKLSLRAFMATSGRLIKLIIKWESSFESIASSDNPAYVANLQRMIAASSRCLILFGGGGFQGMARNLYERFHPDPKSWCIYKVCSCEV